MDSLISNQIRCRAFCRVLKPNGTEHWVGSSITLLSYCRFRCLLHLPQSCKRLEKDQVYSYYSNGCSLKILVHCEGGYFYKEHTWVEIILSLASLTRKHNAQVSAMKQKKTENYHNQKCKGERSLRIYRWWATQWGGKWYRNRTQQPTRPICPRGRLLLSSKNDSIYYFSRNSAK